SAAAVNRYYESRDQLHNLIARIRSRKSNDVYKQRSLVTAKLKAVIDSIHIYPEREKPNFEVRFLNQTTRFVFVDPSDPLKFVYQTLDSGGEMEVIEPSGDRFVPLYEDNVAVVPPNPAEHYSNSAAKRE